LGFGALFLLQSGLFVWVATRRPDIAFRLGTSLRAFVGSLFLLYALLAYPVLGAILGHGYPLSPSFGLTPCPTVIFTFGLLLWAEGSVPASLLVIPFLWALVGFNAALRLGVPEDAGLLVASLAGVPLLLSGRPGPRLVGRHQDKATPQPKRLPGRTVPRSPAAPGR